MVTSSQIDWFWILSLCNMMQLWFGLSVEPHVEKHVIGPICSTLIVTNYNKVWRWGRINQLIVN